MPARIPWVFTDPVENTTEEMQVNPNSGAAPEFSKNIVKKATVGPGGAVVIFEGNDNPQQMEFSGVILTEAHYNFLLTAYQKRHVVALTDDLGRTFQIYFESFKPTRKLSRTYPWRHDYSATVVIVG